MAKLYFYYASMNAGKSTALLQANHNYLERGMRTLLFTAKADDRYGDKVIASRIGIQAQSQHFSEEDDLFAIIEESHASESLDCALFDEAQFLTKEQVSQLGRVADVLKVPVLVYGLRTDFQGELFEGSSKLLALADELREIKTICHCGSKATMVARLGADGRPMRTGAQIQVGGNETYVSMCRKHWKAALNEDLVD